MIDIIRNASPLKTALRSSTAIGLLTVSQMYMAPAQAQEAGTPPAVSSVNAKFAIAGGIVEGGDFDANGFGGIVGSNPYDDGGSEELALFLASLTAPLTHDFGAQLDVALGSQGGDFVGGIGGHAFWRDPQTGLLGITGGYAVNERESSNIAHLNPPSRTVLSAIGKQEIFRLAAEGELYQGRFTFHAVAGYQWGENIFESAFVQGGVKFYATDNFMVGIGGGASDEIGGFASAEMEYLADHGISVFTDMRTEFDDYVHAIAGIRVYFGQSDTLIAKHRYDDPAGNAAQDAIAGMQETRTVTDAYYCCFTAETAILMADGSTKQIADVRIGDLVLGEGECVNRVQEIETPCLGERKLYAFNDGAPFVTAEHPFMTRDGWKSIDPEATFAETGHFRVDVLATGDELVVLANVSTRAVPMVSGEPAAQTETVVETAHIALAKIDAHEGDTTMTVYNLRLDGNHTYFANKFLVHNK